MQGLMQAVDVVIEASLAAVIGMNRCLSLNDTYKNHKFFEVSTKLCGQQLNEVLIKYDPKSVVIDIIVLRGWKVEYIVI